MNQTLLKAKVLTLLFAFTALYQPALFGQAQTVVKGKVTETNGKPISGVTVVEVSNSDRQLNGTSSDETGNFSLKVSNTANRIRFSYIGFNSRTETTGTRTEINARLTRDTGDNVDVVVAVRRSEQISTGITTTSKRDLIGSVASVSSEVLASQPSTSLDQMIQGRAAGVQIVSSSGDPGAGVDIRIRGAGSISGGNDPLYIIDGIPIVSTPFDNSNAGANVARINPIADINPADIERIDILKDANAAAIYGARAANGVIVITTKRGRKGVTNINLKTQHGLRQPPPAIPLLNGSQYKVMRLEAEQAAGNINPTSAQTWPISDDPTYPFYWYYQSNTDWLSHLRQTGVFQDYNLQVSGGGEAMTYNFTTSYNDQKGAWINTGAKRITSSFRLDYKVSNKLRFSANISFARSFRNTFPNYTGQEIYQIGLIRSPAMPVYDVNLATGAPLSNYLSLGGIQGGLDNPIALAKTNSNFANGTTLRPNIQVNYNILSNLRFNSTASLEFVGESGLLYLPPQATGLIWNDRNFNRVDSRDNERVQMILENKLYYNKTFFEKLKTNIVIGNTFNTFNSKQFVEGGFAAPSDQIRTLSGSARIGTLSANTNTETIISLFGQTDFVWNDKYGFNVVVRRDGSSKFGGNNKYGVFPSVGGYWRASGEPFIKENFKFINDLKFRATWGQLGNSGIPNYAYISQFTSGASYIGIGGVRQQNPELTNLRWETIESTNLGVDVDLFKKNLQITVDVYNKLTRDLLFNLPVPSSSGILNQITNNSGGTVLTNLGNIQNRGIEVSVNYDFIRSKKTGGLLWSTNFNLGRNVNEVTSLPGGTLRFTDGYSGFGSQVKQGDALGTYYGFVFKGVYANDADAIVRDGKGNIVYELDGTTPRIMKLTSENGNIFKGGDAIYEDFNHDGIINDQDRILVGNANPKFFGGLNNTISYKNYVVNFFVLFQQGNDVINGMRYLLESMQNTDNQAITTLQRWRKQGDVTNMPRALRGDTRNIQGSSRWIEDGSFARLKNVALTYNFDNSLVKRIKLKGLSATILGTNLFTWSNYTGTDPEIQIGNNPAFIGVDRGLNPQTKGFTISLNARF